MRHPGLAIAGVVLLAIGLCGLLASVAVTPRAIDPRERTPNHRARRYPDGSLRDRRGIRVPDTALPPEPPVALTPTRAPEPEGGSGDYSGNGERIYRVGEGHAGPIASTGGWTRGRGTVAVAGCADCHGADGTGGRTHGMGMSDLQIPDIRYAALATKRSEDGTTVPAWTDAQIARAIRDGVGPDGKRLNTIMPRFRMDTTDMKDLIGYLKELSGT
jgi:mono/diheme cytochrome c family protein